ncbi:MAG TPA: aminotransferase class I/II-fold pyridoxal phosphate-dependent enzyme [Phycisphaerales bacterium]|nr:aminotransferase class I/II-fold pyridoxal phosphate-dependent enzyme [Phycisphaerales bacterium]
MEIERIICDRTRAIDASGIRRVFQLGRDIPDKVDLSIGQPDFPVPDNVKDAAIRAILEDRNGYTLTQGVPELHERVGLHLAEDLGWPADSGRAGSDVGTIVSTGTSGALHIAFLAILGQGDEIIIPDPYFVAYPHMAKLCGANAVRCPVYPDFRMTAARVEPLMTKRTKAVLLNSPGNPSGVVNSTKECNELLELCRSKNVLLISDEIYDEFTFEDAREETGRPGLGKRCPSPARVDRAWEDVLLVRGFGKTFGCTGWRMGYTSGPRPLIEAMSKMQQYSFVCAPTPLQWGCLETFRTDMTAQVEQYRQRRDMVVERLSKVTEIVKPGGAFYVFAPVPKKLELTSREFFERALAKKVLIIPGDVFSDRDTHFRLSYAVADSVLEKGLDVLEELMRG